MTEQIKDEKPRFCGDCKHCADNLGTLTTRNCAAAPARRERHIEKHGGALDAWLTAPETWVYVNSAFASRCEFFSDGRGNSND